MKTQFKLFAMAMAVASLAACSHHNPKASSDDSAAKQASLSKAFQGVDGTYNPADLTLANKIEGISLQTNGKPARGIVLGQILISGQAAPLNYSSDAFDTSTLKAGSKVDIAVDGLADDNEIGGQLTGTFTCLNDDCSKAGVYFRFYQGAGFIFQQQADGSYKLVTSVGKTVSLEEAMAKRGLAMN